MIQITDDTITVRFQRPFHQDAYKLFLQSKKLPEHTLEYDEVADLYRLTAPARFASVFGLPAPVVDRGWLPFSSHLKDFQSFTARVALDAKRFACWWTTGLGKTHLEWELSRQIVHRTGGKVLLIVPIDIISQTLEVGAEWFGMTARRLESRGQLKSWCLKPGPEIGIVNPEKFLPKNGDAETISEVKRLAGVLLDEASLLASGGGRTKWALIHSCKGVEYKFTLTATPARNETMDYASQGSFLEKIEHEGEVIWTYFQRDQKDDGAWKLKKNAEADFYRFLSGWSMYMVDPKRYGFDDYLQGIPEPEFIEHKIPPTSEQRAMIARQPDPRGQLSLFGNRDRLTLVDRSRYGQISRGFLYGKDKQRDTKFIPSLKPAFVRDLIVADAAEGRQPLVWTIFDEESRVIEGLLKGSGLRVEVLHGSIPKHKRPAIIDRYRRGECDALISKAELLGFGLHLVNCASMIFSGFDDSGEEVFQAIRRAAYRYGQTRSVRIHIPYIPELEGVVWANVKRKQAQYEKDARIMEKHYIEAMKGALHAA